MSEFIPLVGPWFWWIVAGALLVGELLAPGVFLLWLSAAAALTGVVSDVREMIPPAPKGV